MDLRTGSGALAIALARYRSSCLRDDDVAALAYACRSNAELAVELVEADVTAGILRN